ncbi:MAG: hypothetical protein ACJ787_14270 [Myxococcales bacterium]
MATLHEILERARAAQQRIPPGESAWLLAAVVRIAAARNTTLRSRLVQLDANGNVSVLPFMDSRPDEELSYRAPELFGADAPPMDEPRVQVYAAGALGYELLTGQTPPDPRVGPGTELSGPIGDVLRMAMARDRRERFASLEELRQAIDALQRRVGADKERLAFAALVARSEKWTGMSDLDRAAIAKLIEQVAHLHRQMEAVRSGMAEVQREQREVEAKVADLDVRSQKAEMAAEAQRSRAGRALAVASIAGAVIGAIIAALALALLSPRFRPVPTPVAHTRPAESR